MKTKDPLVQKVLDKMAERSEIGIKKFGITMQDADHSIEHWIENTIEELGDAMLYLQKLKDEIRKKEDLWNLKSYEKK